MSTRCSFFIARMVAVSSLDMVRASSPSEKGAMSGLQIRSLGGSVPLLKNALTCDDVHNDGKARVQCYFESNQ